MTRVQIRLELLRIVFRQGREPKHILEDVEELEPWLLEVFDDGKGAQATAPTTKKR